MKTKKETEKGEKEVERERRRIVEKRFGRRIKIESRMKKRKRKLERVCV